MAVKIEQFFVVLFVFYGAQSEAKSLRSSQTHKITKRQLSWVDTCPPAYIENIERKSCMDTCHSNDYCPGRQLCCENGAGCRSCMDPVPPPAVIDWVKKIPAPPGDETDNTIELKPIYAHEDVIECLYEGRSYPNGVFYRGCKKCFCNGRYISCAVGPCKSAEKTVFHSDKERAPGYEGSAGSGHDSSEHVTTATPITDHNSNEFRPIIHGEGEKFYEIVAPKAEFIAFDPPASEHNEIKETGESGQGESGDGKSGNGESGDGDNLEEIVIKHSTNRATKITRHDNEVDELQKVGDIFLI